MTTKGWVVWYEHWRYHHATVQIWQENTKKSAFDSAYFLANEADDCVNELIGIEGPDGFIDMQEYRDAEDAIGEARDAANAAMWKADEEQPKFKIIVTGPEGFELAEVWSEKYLEEYKAKRIAQFGEDRVTVVPVKEKVK